MIGLLLISISDLFKNCVAVPNLDPVPAVGINTVYDIINMIKYNQINY
jgi:hypothetical protein